MVVVENGFGFWACVNLVGYNTNYKVFIFNVDTFYTNKLFLIYRQPIFLLYVFNWFNIKLM